MTELEHKRKKRRKITAEDFTPLELVDEMLDKLPSEVWDDPEKTFLDNSAGNGNFLIRVLDRKLKKNHEPLEALSTIYGVELMADNVEEMHERIFKVLLDHYPNLNDKEKNKARSILKHNIVCADALEWDYENWKKPKKYKSDPLF